MHTICSYYFAHLLILTTHTHMLVSVRARPMAIIACADLRSNDRLRLKMFMVAVAALNYNSKSTNSHQYFNYKGANDNAIRINNDKWFLIGTREVCHFWIWARKKKISAHWIHFWKQHGWKNTKDHWTSLKRETEIPKT